MCEVAYELSKQVLAAHADAWQLQGHLRDSLGGGALELRGIRLMASGLPHPQWNSGHVTAADADLEGARVFYAERGLPWGVQVPAALPWAAGRLLFRKQLMGLPARGLRPAPSVPELEVRSAGPGELDTIAAIDASAFDGVPELSRAWLGPLPAAPVADLAIAHLGGEPLASAYSLLTDGLAGPCVYLGGVAVLPAARRRGVGTAVSAWLLERGFRSGARLAVLHADHDGAARIYARLGFTPASELDVYEDL